MLRVRIGLHRGNSVGSAIPRGAGDGPARPARRPSRTPEGSPGAPPEGSELGIREGLGHFTLKGIWTVTEFLVVLGLDRRSCRRLAPAEPPARASH